METVLFVKSEDEITAVFITKELISGATDTATCYSHVGQHSTCSLEWVLDKDSVVSASYEESQVLRRELINIGYRRIRSLMYEDLQDELADTGNAVLIYPDSSLKDIQNAYGITLQNVYSIAESMDAVIAVAKSNPHLDSSQELYNAIHEIDILTSHVLYGISIDIMNHKDYIK